MSRLAKKETHFHKDTGNLLHDSMVYSVNVLEIVTKASVNESDGL